MNMPDGKTLLFLFVCVFVLLKVATITKVALRSDLRRIPGPWYAPWTNLWLKLQVLKGQRSQYIHTLHEKYGDFVRIAPDELAIADLDAFRAIHRVGSGFNKSNWYFQLNPDPYPGIFVMADPKQHASRRRLFAQAFSNSAVKTWEELIRQRVQTAVAKIKRDAEIGYADVLKWFTFMATDIVGELSFGKSFEMLQTEEKCGYINDLELAMIVSGMRVELGWLYKAATYLPIPKLQHLFAINIRLNAYGHEAIQNYKAHQAGSNGSKGGTSTFFSRMFDGDKHAALKEVEIEHEASNLIVAGSDTTGITLTYFTWALLHSNNRRVRDRLVAEVATLPANPSEAELSALPYLNAVIKETLRLYGAAPASLPRIVPKGGATLGGYQLFEGTTVCTQAYTIHRDPRIFRDPLLFNPDRWLHADKTMNEAYHPFGSGSRTCLGIHLAMLELLLGAYAVVKECGAASVAPSTKDEDMEFENYFLITPKSHKCEITLCEKDAGRPIKTLSA